MNGIKVIPYTVQYSTVQYRSYLEALIQPLVQPPKLCSTMRNDFDEEKKNYYYMLKAFEKCVQKTGLSHE